MKSRILIVLIAIVLLVAVAITGAVVVWSWPRANAAASGVSLDATGVIEARTVKLAPEIGAKVTEVLVEGGQRVEAGQPLVKLDDEAVRIQRAQAEAALRAAKANLAFLKSGATSDQLKAAEAQLAQAEAGQRAAQAALDTATAGARPEEVAAIRANLDRLRNKYAGMTGALNADQLEDVRAALTTAEGNLSQIKARREDLARDLRNPTYVIDVISAAVVDADAAVAAARAAYEAARDETQPYWTRIERARLSWEVAQANLRLTQARRTRLVDDKRTPTDALEAADATLADAQKQLDAAKTAYSALTANGSTVPLDATWTEVQRAQTVLSAFAPMSRTASVSVEMLLVQIDGARAGRDVAAANLAMLKSGARAEQLDAAQSQVDAAQAQLDALNLQLRKLTLTAPWDGVVLARSAEPGQVALPGGTLLEIGRLDTLELTVYLPEERFGLVTPGQLAMVRVDAYPQRTFQGSVLRVADEAEFTPTSVQTKEDRTRLVYAAVIKVANPDLALKPGMIADVEFQP